MSDTNGSGKPKFDFTLNLGSLVNLVAIIGTGLAALWSMSGDFSRQFARLEGSLERLGQRLELTVQRLDQRDEAHSDRIKTLERRSSLRGIERIDPSQ